MIRLAWTMLRASGPGRPVLIATCTALSTGLLLVVVAMLRLPADPVERLFNLVAEPGLRYGTAFGTLLLVLPLMLLLYQSVRLGTATRERRFAALRLAGATQREVSRLGAVEVGLPAAVGAVGGIAVYGLLRVFLGGTSWDGEWLVHARAGLVPTTVTPTWWQSIVIIAAVTILGVAIGGLASRRTRTTPLGVSRRAPARPPRPWGFGLLAGALGTAAAAIVVMDRLERTASVDGATTVLLGVAILLAVSGMIALAPWLAYRIGRRLQSRSASPETVLAAAQLAGEPRSAGRAAAGAGAVALVAGGGGATAVEGFVINAGHGLDFFWVGSTILVAIVLLAALLVVVGTMAVHAVESVLDRRRALAASVAAGVPVDTVHAAQRRAAALAALPVAAAGAVIGTVAMTLLYQGMDPTFPWHVLGGGLATTTAIVALTWLAVHIVAAALRPWVVRATAPANLRTE